MADKILSCGEKVIEYYKKHNIKPEELTVSQQKALVNFICKEKQK